MKLTIIRGAHEIGGSCVEVASGQTRLLLDVGLPLDGWDGPSPRGQRSRTDPRITSVFAAQPPVRAVLLSHAHSDHTGLLTLAPPATPVYLTQGTSKMLMAGALYARQPKQNHREEILEPGSPERIGEFTVTAYPVDHSAFDSVALLVEAEGQRLLYSGDLRLHGRKPGMARKLVQAVTGRVDVLLMEGTRFSGGSRGQQTEYELEDQIAKDIATAPGLVLASFSPQHVDRLVTFYKAARRAGRLLALDHYGGFVLHLVSGQAKLPRPRASAGVRIFLPRSQKRLAKVARNFADCETTLEEILADPHRYVMLFRPQMIADEFRGQLPDGVSCIYSFWSGYLEKPAWQETRTKVARAGGTLLERHTSGHIQADQIVPFVNSIAPRWVVPIHSNRPEAFTDLLPNAQLLRDGECWDLQASPQALVNLTQ